MVKTYKRPSISATKFRLGTKKKGNDGNIWKIVQNKHGTMRWLKESKTSKKQIKTSKNREIAVYRMERILFEAKIRN